MAAGESGVKIGVLVTGNTAVRAAHSLSAHPGISEVVVVGPARSRSFEVVATADDCDFLIGTGPRAPETALRHGVPLIWDGERAEEGIAVWGAAPSGLTLALAAREQETSLVALAHPGLDPSVGRPVRFPDPVGTVEVDDGAFGSRPIARGKSENDFAACLVSGPGRSVTVVDHGPFMTGISLAAGVALVGGEPVPVWERALPYLKTATAMGLVMAEG